MTSRATAGSLVLAAVLAYGCVAMDPGGVPDTDTSDGAPTDAADSRVERFVVFMKQAAAAGGAERQRMLTDLDRRSVESPVTARLQRGFLLTSPSETMANTREGEKILRETLAGSSDLDPALRDLIELRLHEVGVRQALRVELGEAKGTIKDLLSIESSMEQKRTESQDRTR